MTSGPCERARERGEGQQGRAKAPSCRLLHGHELRRSAALLDKRSETSDAGGEGARGTHDDAAFANLDARADARRLDNTPCADRDVVADLHRVEREDSAKEGRSQEEDQRNPRRRTRRGRRGDAPLVRLVAGPEDDSLAYIAVPPDRNHDRAALLCSPWRRARTPQVPAHDAPVPEDRLAGKDDVLGAADTARAADEIARVGRDVGRRFRGGRGRGGGRARRARHRRREGALRAGGWCCKPVGAREAAGEASFARDEV